MLVFDLIKFKDFNDRLSQINKKNHFMSTMLRTSYLTLKKKAQNEVAKQTARLTKLLAVQILFWAGK